MGDKAVGEFQTLIQTAISVTLFIESTSQLFYFNANQHTEYFRRQQASPQVEQSHASKIADAIEQVFAEKQTHAHGKEWSLVHPD